MAKNKTEEKKENGILSSVKWVYVALSAFMIILGVCTFIWPELTAGTICCAVAIGAILFGIIKIIIYFLREVEGIGQNYDLSVGAAAVIGGVLVLVFRDSIVGLMQVAIGVYLLVDSVFKLQTAVDAKRLGVSGWWVSLLFTLACIAFGVILVTGVGANMLMVLVGIALIVDGLQNICLVVFSAMAAKALARMDKDGDGHPDIIDATDVQNVAPPPAADAAEIKPDINLDTEGENDPW